MPINNYYKIKRIYIARYHPFYIYEKLFVGFSIIQKSSCIKFSDAGNYNKVNVNSIFKCENDEFYVVSNDYPIYWDMTYNYNHSMYFGRENYTLFDPLYQTFRYRRSIELVIHGKVHKFNEIYIFQYDLCFLYDGDLFVFRNWDETVSGDFLQLLVAGLRNNAYSVIKQDAICRTKIFNF